MRPRDRLADLRRAAAGGDTVQLHTGGECRDTVEPHTHPHYAHIHTLLQEVERMHAWIHELNSNTQLLRRLHAHPTYHTNKQLQDQLESVVRASSGLGAQVCAALRSLEAGAAVLRNDAAARIARLQYATTRAQFAEALGAHHAALAVVRDVQRDLLHEQIKLTNLTISDEECESLLESKNLSLFVDNVGAESADARRVLREVEARRDELARVESSLRDVRDLFTQLAVLVAAQQQQIDSVEYYALQATEHVESGGHHLLKGTVSRTKSRKKKTSLIICVCMGALVVLLVLVYT